MKSVKIVTSDNKIWNPGKVYKELAYFIYANEPFVIDFLNEGPDLNSIGLYRFLEESGVNLENVTIDTANAVERHDKINIVYRSSVHLLDNAKDYITDIVKQQELKHFGMFIGRSNAPRLHLATYLRQYYNDKSLLSYHFNVNDDFHINNIGLEDLVKIFNIHDIRQETEFICQCPITLGNRSTVHNDKGLELNYAQQLFKNDRQEFTQTYNEFFVELVCESYYTGNTFFPTEKTFRPMLLKTPFIVQGPQYFLQNLKKLGFKTFHQWWDEGYAEDDVAYQVKEIKKLLDFLSAKTPAELYDMNKSMAEVLEHNYQTAIALTKEDYQKIRQ